MEYLKIFEQFTSDESLKEWAYEYAKDHHDGLNCYEDAVEELDIFFEHEYPTFKSDFKLIRIVQVENESDINLDKLGNHYLDPEYKQRIFEKGWIESVGLDIYDGQKLFLVEVQASHGDVDWEDTIHNRLAFPREFEITLKNNPEILSITEIDSSKIR
jgi:hypothetical protein